MKKKSVVLMLIMTAVLFLFSCGKEETGPEKTDSQQKASEQEKQPGTDSAEPTSAPAEPTAVPVKVVPEEVKLPDNPKQVIFNRQYRNFAEVPMNYGYLITADGGIYYYNFAYGTDISMRKEASADVLPETEFVTRYSTPVGYLEETALKEFYGLIQQVNMREKLETEHAACDAGSHTLAVSTNGVNFCILSESGDIEGKLTGPGAAATLEFIDKTVMPALSDCSVPYNEEKIYISPEHCEIVKKTAQNGEFGDLFGNWNLTSKYLIRSREEADYLKNVYGIDLSECFSSYNDYFSYMYYAVMYNKVFSTSFDVDYAGFEINSNGILPIPSESYSAPEDEFYDDGTGVEEFLTIAEIPMDSLYCFYDDDYAVPEWSSLPGYNSEAEEYAVKIGDDFHLKLVPEEYSCTEDTCSFTFKNAREADMPCRMVINVVCDRAGGKILGAFSMDSSLQWGSFRCCVFDADGNIVLDEESDKPYTLIAGAEQKEEDAVILYNEEDIRELDTMKASLLSVSDLDTMDEFSDVVTIADGGWYKIILSRELACDSKAGGTAKVLKERLVFLPAFSVDYGWGSSDEGLTLADYSISRGKLSDGTDYTYEIKETPGFPETNSFYTYAFYGKDGNLICSSEEIWETGTDSGTLGSIRINDGNGEELFWYDGVMSYISGVDIAELRDGMEADKAVFNAENDEVIADILKEGLDYVPTEDAFKTIYLTASPDNEHSIKADIMFFDYMGEADAFFMVYMNDTVIIASRAFGGH